jgi:uncharacterized protein YjiS (DUF1127 family)
MLPSLNSCVTFADAVRRIMDVSTSLCRAMRRRRRRRADLDVLLDMDHRLLADIGLRRGDLDAVMAGVVPIEQIASPVEEPAPVRLRPILVLVPGGRGDALVRGDLDAAA